HEDRARIIRILITTNYVSSHFICVAHSPKNIAHEVVHISLERNGEGSAATVRDICETNRKGIANVEVTSGANFVDDKLIVFGLRVGFEFIQMKMRSEQLICRAIGFRSHAAERRVARVATVASQMSAVMHAAEGIVNRAASQTIRVNC